MRHDSKVAQQIKTPEEREMLRDASTIRDFQALFYDRHDSTWLDTRFMNVPVLKYATDLWIYQEIIVETKPDVILETGTAFGGSALYLAFLCQNLGRGEVISVDIQGEKPGLVRPKHPLVTYLTGSSTDDTIVNRVWKRCRGKNVLVILDSDHKRDHVLAEMRAYAGLVPVGGYMIVEDGIVNGHPCFHEHGPGPMEAIESWFEENQNFRVDESREKFLLTQNPCGFLVRVSEETK